MSIIRKSIATLFIFMALLVPLFLPASIPLASAQETTEEAVEPTPVVTEIPTEAPSELPPTEASPVATEENPTTESPTPAPEQTEEVTETAPEATDSVEVTEEATEEMTPDAPIEQTEEVSEAITSYSDDFSVFNSDKWSLVGWSVSDGTLSTTQTASSATLIGFEPVNFELNAQVLIPENNVLVIAFRGGNSHYRAVLSSNSSSRLYRDDALLDAYASSNTDSAWMPVHILVANDTIAISTNGIAGIVYTDTPSLTDGRIDFLTDAAVSAEIQVDNLSISAVDPATVVFPAEYVADAPVEETTVAPEATAETTLEPEITPETTLEPEATAETTAEPEITPEATVDAEVTPEVTPEVTEEPISETALYDKSPANLHAVLDMLQDEENELADSTARLLLEYDGYLIDVNGSVGLVINPAENITSAQIEQLVIQLGGRATVVAVQTVTAFMPLDSLIALLENPMVESVAQPDVARSTGNSPSPGAAPGTATYTEGFDMLGLTDWHDAGYNGTGVRVGVIDTGYNTIIANDPEYACLAGPLTIGVPNNHGLAMVQLICDMAPGASVYTYEVAASSYAGLASAVYQAIADDVDVLVITLNMMEVAPGDGTGQQDGDDPYYALTQARNQGMVIFAAAGNSGTGYTDGGNPYTSTGRAERFVTLNVPYTAADTDVAEFTIQATAGDSIVVTWNDWIDDPQGDSDPANIEDFDITIELAPPAVDTPPIPGRYDADLDDADPENDHEGDNYYVDAFGVEVNNRQYLFDDPSVSYELRPTLDLDGPEIAGVLRKGCPVLEPNEIEAGAFDSECTVIVTITRVRGDSPVTMQVGIIPANTTAVDPLNPRDVNQNINELVEITSEDITILDFDGLGVSSIIGSHQGTIARPADSPDVIAVGAVCANEDANFALAPASSQGPIFSPGGEANAQSAPTTFVDTKPEILSASFVSTTFNDADVSACDGSINGTSDSKGFGGTSAAAGHAAAMTAVLLSNPTYRTMLDTNGVQAIEDYIMTHAVELPLGTTADGLDYLHGAGFFILGSPIFNPANTQNLTDVADLITVNGQCDVDGNGTGDGGFLYVGQANPASTQAGTIANPYTSIGAAIGAAGGTTCIIVMPGEYVTPLVIDGSNIHIYGYDSVTGNLYPQSIIYATGQYTSGIQTVDTIDFNLNAAVYFDSASNSSVNGFTFVHTNTEDGLPRQAVLFDGATNSTLSNSQIGTFTVDGINYSGWINGDATPVIVVDSNEITILENHFYGNIAGISVINRLDTLISVLNSGGTTPIDIVRNRFEANTAVTQRQSAGSNYWATLLYSGNSDSNVVGNEFVGNTASTLIASRTADGGTEAFNVVSNVFLNNTMSLTRNAGDPNYIPGSPIQLYHTPEFIFANNTVVLNNMTAAGGNGAIIGMGTPQQASLDPNDFDTSITVTGIASFDFVNNLIYANDFAPNIADGLVSTLRPTGITDCASRAGTPSRGPQHNWWHNYPADFDLFAPCFYDIVDNANDNLTFDDPSPDFVGNLPDSTLNANTDPEFYALRETALLGVFSRGIDYSDIIVTSGGLDLSDMAEFYGFDANGEPRITDVIPWEGFTGTGNDPSPYDIDTGAYEFRELTLVGDLFSYTNGAYTALLTFTEDDPFISINLESRVTGGLGDLTFSLVNPPEVYGTHCGPEYTVANNGTFFGTGANATRVFYCPPLDFYTGGGSDIADLTLDYMATDAGGQSQQEPVTFIIDSVHEAISLNNIQATNGDLNYIFIGNLGQEVVGDLQLRPFVDYVPNFAYSERANPHLSINGVTAVDYPFNYGGLSTSGTTAIFDSGPTINGDFLDFTLSETVEGVATVSYTVSDTQGGQLTVNVTVNNVSRLPNEPGIYDDSSFAFDYTGNWSAISDSTAINNTLHTVREANATASFGIRGSGFSLYMDGSRPGGDWDLQIDIDANGNYQSVTGWQLLDATADPDNPSSTVYYAIVEEGTTAFVCTTSAINTLTMSLTSNNLADYIIKCEGYTYPGGGYDFGEETDVAEGVHLVNIVNTSSLVLGVDAFALLDGDAADGVELPLQPGFHDVEDLAMRNAFGSDWQEVAFRTYSNGFAYQLTGPVAGATANNTVSFLVNGGTGFAVGTTTEFLNPDYTICVTDLSNNNMSCQDFDYTLTLVRTLSTPGVYRPFYGLDPDGTYRVDILPRTIETNSKFILDAVIVFEPTDTTSELADGVVDDTDLDKLNYGQFSTYGWDLNSRAIGASNGTTTSVSRLQRTPGPYVSFEVSASIDTIYWTFDARAASKHVMVCVDRAEGVGTNSSPANGLADNLTDVDTAHGNCLVVNLTTGEYLGLGADGVSSLAVDNIRLTSNTIVISEDSFRDDNIAPDERWSGTGNHVIEIFSLYDAVLSVDTITAIGSSDLLTPGRYEEYTASIHYFDDALQDASVDTSESSITSTYTGDFTQVLGRTVRDFGGGIMFTNDVGATIGFEFHGTGFAPAFRLARTAEAVRICWIPTANTVGGTLSARVGEALSDGDCATFDNENRLTTYNALRPILGLTEADYTVAVRFIGDNFLPIANRAAEPEMWFDGVVIYDEDLSTLTPMSNGVTYDANYLRRNESNTFAYFGSNWSTTEGIRARLYHNSDVDTILRGEAGATIAFRVSGANVITLLSPLGRTNTPLLVCADDGTDRYCQTISVYGVGNDAEFSIYLAEDGLAGNYTVTVTALTGGRLDFDAVTPHNITQPLTEGTYDNSHPNIAYEYGSENLLANGGAERDLAGYWTANNGATIDRYNRRFTGIYAMRVMGGTTPSASSATISLTAGETYAIIGYIQVDRLTGGEVTVTIDNLTNGDPVPTPLTTDTSRNGIYEPFRFDFTPQNDIDIQITFEGTAGTTFYVDDVQVAADGQWQATFNRLAYGGYYATSTAHGSQFSFSLTGTGFAMAMPTGIAGGEVQVCYDDNAALSSPECITYQQEGRTNSSNLRVVEGLAYGTYYVRVRDVEDGNSAGTASRYPISRAFNRTVGVITLDYISILNTSVPEITESGIYETTASDGNGAPYMTTVPAESWSTITGRLAIRYSDSSYTTVVNSRGVSDRFASGPAAMFNLDLSTHGTARVLLDVYSANRLASKQLLACIGGPDGELVRQPYVAAERNLDDYELENSDNCVLIETLPTSSIIALTPDILPGLTDSSDAILTVQTLTGGTFLIDSYQILYGGMLSEGYYEESIGNDILGVSSEWVSTNNRLYSGGSALVASESSNGNGESLSFNFVGTGISIVTGHGFRNGALDIDLVNTGNGSSECSDVAPAASTIDTSGDPAVDTYNALTVYGTSISYAGLPCDEYSVTITAQLDALESVAIDAIQIYGELPSLGSLYDDAQVDTNGNPLIAYGPDNDAWAFSEGRFALTALNQTLHSTIKYGAVASFEIGETLVSDGILIYYDARLTTAPEVRVCFRDLVDMSATCTDEELDESGLMRVDAPLAGSGNYFVTIEHIDLRLKFALDAVQVLENGFYEGIYDAETVHLDDGGDTSTFGSITNTVDLAPGQTLTFNIVGVAFSLDVTQLSTIYDYNICVSDAGGCDVINEDNQTVASNSAITYAGLHGDEGVERSLEVTLTNNGNNTLRVNELHVLGDNDSLLIDDSSRYENDATQIRYLPFGSYTVSALPRSSQSGGDEHVSRMVGASVYFEIQTVSPIDAGFEVARQVSLRNGSAEVCYGEIDSVAGGGITTQSLKDARDATQCVTVDHGTGNAYQVGEAIATGTDCENGCWVLVRNLETLTNPFDYVRLYDAGQPMTAGRYQESFTGLHFEDGAGGTWNQTTSPVANRFASGGFIRQATQDPAITTDNGPVMWFVMDGTGFAINYVVDLNADAIEICYAPGTETDLVGVTTNVLEGGVCQVYENESRATVADAARTIVGLPDDIYTVAVRMLPDNGLPRPHLVSRPITMMIDTIDVFDNDITAIPILNNDQLYETSYVNRDSNPNFVFFGDSWVSYEGTRARLNSGLNYDQAREYGAGILFRVQNADALTVYTNLSRVYSPMRVCVLPITADALAPGDMSLARCFDSSLDGRGFGQPISFRFRDFLEDPASDYMVSIVSMTNGFFPIDAIEVTNTGAGLTEGRYESNDANLFYDGRSIDYIVNGSMEIDASWEEAVQPEVLFTPTARYSGRYGYSVNGNRGSGLESQSFNLTGATTDAPIMYTAIARVKVLSGSARMELVEGQSPLSIDEFRAEDPAIAEANSLVWQTLRVDFSLTDDITDLRLQIVSNSFDSTFYVDEVHLYEGGSWTSGTTAFYSNAHAGISQTPGSSMSFSFTGTGFEIGTAYDATGGEFEVCYDDDDLFEEVGDLTDANCFIYQNESRGRNYNVSRAITGLAQGLYYVRVRDVEDGYTVTGRTLGTARSIRYPVGQLTIDWVTIFDDTAIPTITSGFFNENATDSQGEPYLRLYPEDAWSSVEGRFARGYSNESYYAALDRRTGRTGLRISGSTAMLHINVPDDGANVILYTGAIRPTANSNLVLICAGGDVTGEIVQVETLVGIRTLLTYALESENTPGDCVVRDGKVGAALMVGPDDLAALSVQGTDVPISFTPLEPGQFYIDGFQVIQGTVLTPGVYDEFLPDTLLDFNSSGSDVSSDDTSYFCDDNTLWCPRKSRLAFGGEQIQTQEAGATLEFDINGTGFSVLTEVGIFGAEMRICYTQTPINGEASFPSRQDTMSGGVYDYDNTAEDLTLGGIWCDLHTTSTGLDWTAIQPERINPRRGNQYGFSYYGLPSGNYSVQVMMFEEVIGAARNAIAIDAIAVFGDYNEIPVMGTANSAPPLGNNVLLTDGFYDDSDAALSLEPSTAWSQTATARLGPPFGPFNLTETTTTDAGAIAQMRVDGNAVTLFQTLFIRNTADARVCVLVTDTVIHCTPESSTTASGVENPSGNAPWALAVETANFSQQNRRRAFFAPIMFYGLGGSSADLPHTIIIENRQHGYTLSIDAIQVQD